MLLRDIETLSHTAALDARESLGPLMAGLRGAQRFVFTTNAAEPMFQTLPARLEPDEVRAGIFAPFPKVWVEWPNPENHWNQGFLWISSPDQPQRGLVLTVSGKRDGEGPGIVGPHVWTVDIPEAKIVAMSDTEMAISSHMGLQGAALAAEVAPWQRYWRHMVMLSFSMIASHTVSHTVEADLSKLNRARAKRGVWPLMSYKEIKLTLDAERVATASRGVGTGSMPRHPVRAHLRLISSGRFVIVRAHMRGDARNGTQHHHYTVQTSDDLAA